MYGHRRLFSSIAVALLLGWLHTTGALAQSSGQITGSITDGGTLGPLSGVQVILVGTSTGTLSNGSGQFTISNVPVGQHSLQLRMIGYSPATIDVAVVAGETAVVDAQLSQAAIMLDELVATGTVGAARRREIGNSISSVSTETLEKAPVGSVTDALQASVSGLSITASDGSAGAGSTIRLRGVNSITQGNRPLIYVDGIRLNSNQYASAAMLNPRQNSDAMMDINPNDIERVEVIKGAAATTLYGTEAAGGVIQIFTKSGAGAADGIATWTAEAQLGFSALPELNVAGHQSPAWIDEYGPESSELWLREYLRTAPTQSYDLSVRGRSGNVNYFLSGGWREELGVIETQGMEDWSIRANLGFSATDDLQVRFNNSYTSRHVDWVVNGNQAESFAINVFRGPYGYGLNDMRRILEFDLADNQSHFITGVEFQHTPMAGWMNRLNIGLDFMEQDYGSTEPFGGFFAPQGRRALTRWKNSTKTVDFASTFSWAPSDWFGTATSVGFQAFANDDLLVVATSNNFAGPGVPTIDSGALRNATESRLSAVNAGFFAQEVLSFGDKLFITGGLRVDGNSAFGDDFGLQLYPKISGSYVISDEPFWPELLESTKLRAAWGTSGKAPGYFDATRVWEPVSGQEGLPGVVPENVGNSELGPERTSELELGFDASAYDSRLTADFTWYRQVTDDALIAVPQDPTLGFTGTQLKNVGKLQNQGLELTVNVVPVRTDNLEWTVGTTLSTNQSKALDLGEAGEIYLGAFGALVANQWVREGYPVPSHFSSKLTNPEEIGQPVVEQDEYIGPVYPTRTLFFTTSLDYGALNVSARAEHSGGHYLQSGTYHRQMQRGVWPECFDIQERIAENGLEGLTALQRFTCHYPESPYPGAAIDPADFFKLRSISLGYTLPEHLLPVGESWRVSLSGSNLFTRSGYIGLDPETNDGTSGGSGDTLVRVEYYNIPPARKYTLRLQTNF